MSGLGACRDCGQWIYWGTVEAADGAERNVPYSDSGHTRLHWEECAAQDYVTDDYANTYRVTRCKDCKAAVYWETTTRGRRRPMNAYMDEDTQEYVSSFDCHFDTCTAKAAGRSSNWRAQDGPYRERKRETAGSTSNGSAQSKQAGAWDVQHMAPWLRDLELTWPCTAKDVTSAFRKLALVRHPDMGGSDKAFIRIKVAYDQLRKLVPA